MRNQNAVADYQHQQAGGIERLRIATDRCGEAIIDHYIVVARHDSWLGPLRRDRWATRKEGVLALAGLACAISSVAAEFIGEKIQPVAIDSPETGQSTYDENDFNNALLH